MCVRNFSNQFMWCLVHANIYSHTVHKTVCILTLRVLSNEMDLAENGLSCLHERVKREDFSGKSVRPQSCEGPLKIPHHFIKLFAIRILYKWRIQIRPRPVSNCAVNIFGLASFIHDFYVRFGN
jgi:hypothetical protein